jgi:hypothetical protein
MEMIYFQSLKDVILRQNLSEQENSQSQQIYLTKLKNAQANYLAAEYGIYKINEKKFLETFDEEDNLFSELKHLQRGLIRIPKLEKEVKNKIQSNRAERRVLRKKLSDQYWKIKGNFAVGPRDVDKIFQLNSPSYTLSRDSYEIFVENMKKFRKTKAYEDEERAAIALDSCDYIDLKDLTNRYGTKLGEYQIK